MKKAFLFLIAAVLITGCNSNDNNENENENTNENNNEAENENKDVYQIGETAQINAVQGSHSYEVTVNDFELAKEYDGKEAGEFSEGEASDNYRVAIVNVSIKNIGEDSFVPSETLYGELMGEITHVSPEADIFTDRNEELESGDEITGDLVYVSNAFVEDKVVFLTYEPSSNEETKFELPIPEEQ